MAKQRSLAIVMKVRDESTKTIAKISKQFPKLAGSISKIAPIAAGAGAAIGALAVPIGLVTSKLIEMAKEQAVVGDKYNKMSQSVGVAVEDLSLLGFAAEQGGSSLDGMGRGLKALSKNALDMSRGMGEAKREFEDLGIEVLDSSGNLKDMSTLTLEIADKFSTMEDGTLKTAMAQRLFGKAGLELIPVLNGGAAAMQKVMDKGKELGVQWSTLEAQQAADFNDRVNELTHAFEGLEKKIATELLPTMTDTVDVLTDIVVAMKDVSGVAISLADDLTKPTRAASNLAIELGKVWLQMNKIIPQEKDELMFIPMPDPNATGKPKRAGRHKPKTDTGGGGGGGGGGSPKVDPFIAESEGAADELYNLRLSRMGELERAETEHAATIARIMASPYTGEQKNQLLNTASSLMEEHRQIVEQADMEAAQAQVDKETLEADRKSEAQWAEIQRITEIQLTEREQLQVHLGELYTLREQGLVSEQEYANAKADLNESIIKSDQKQNRAELQAMSQKASAAKSAATSIVSLVGGSAKAQAYIEGGHALVQAAISAAEAIGPPLNPQAALAALSWGVAAKEAFSFSGKGGGGKSSKSKGGGGKGGVKGAGAADPALAPSGPSQIEIRIEGMSPDDLVSGEMVYKLLDEVGIKVAEESAVLV